jgi:hypothetical protein
LISVSTCAQYFAPLTALSGPQAEDVPGAVDGDADGHVDGPVGDLAVADLDWMASMKMTG